MTRLTAFTVTRGVKVLYGCKYFDNDDQARAWWLEHEAAHEPCFDLDCVQVSDAARERLAKTVCHIEYFDVTVGQPVIRLQDLIALEMLPWIAFNAIQDPDALESALVAYFAEESRTRS